MSHANGSDRKMERRDYQLVGVAMLLTVLGLSWDQGRSGIGLAITALPVGAFVLIGHIPGKGAAIACLCLASGTVLTPMFFSDNNFWHCLVVLGGIALAAMMSGTLAERLSQIVAGSGSIHPGRWVHVYVESEGPSDPGGRLVRPKVSPHSPERRRLSRLALSTGRFNQSRP